MRQIRLQVLPPRSRNREGCSEQRGRSEDHEKYQGFPSQ